MRHSMDRGSRLLTMILAVAGLLCTTGAVLADVVSLSPSKDNTLYESATGSLSNGAGQHFFAGKTAILTGGVIRRALLSFDIAGNIPAGSTISSVTLTLNMSRTALANGQQLITLHRVLADWGEGTSDPLGGEGGGIASTAGDATWIHTFFNTAFWTNAGGDFSATFTASQNVDLIGFYTWGSTAAMVADVQDWLDNPGANFGWLLRGNELTLQTAKRFDSRQNLTPLNRPVLTIDFTPPSLPAGEVPNGDDVPGIPFTMKSAAGGMITLEWSDSCLAGDIDYAIYEGTLGIFYSHDARFCSTGGATSVTFVPSGGNTYYLVVPRNAFFEGSYGRDKNDVERPQGGLNCLPQAIGSCP